MDRRLIKKAFKRFWRKNQLRYKGARPGVSIGEIARASEKRNRSKTLPYFDLWNEIYDEYVSWVFSLLTVQYQELRRRRLKGRRYQFHRATAILLFRIFSDLLSIRILCRAGFDVAAKGLTRSTIEHIDTLALIIRTPTIAREFNKSERNEISNKFWHTYLTRGKARAVLRQIWKERLGEDFEADGFDEWLYRHHDVLGMSIHPSFSGSVFSAITLGSKSTDKWMGFLGDRADISADTFYELILHIWKIQMLFPDFPFLHESSNGLAARYNKCDELHRHVKIGGRILASTLISIWDPKISGHFFRKLDVSDVFPPQKSRRRRKYGPL